MTTPTPPDAVREALERELINALGWVDSVPWFNLCELLGLEGDNRSSANIARALLTRPSDARGRG